MEGLPPQLQSQHLKFIRDTTLPEEQAAKKVAADAKRSSAKHGSKTARAEETISYKPESARSQIGADKPNISALTARNLTYGHDEKSVEKSLEPVREDQSPLINKQKKFMTRKVHS